MLLQFAILLLTLHVATAQRILAVDQGALREEFRRQVSAVIEQTTTNVSRFHQLQCGIEGAALRDEISEQTNTTLELIAESNREHKSTAEELKECIREDLDTGLRQVTEELEITVTQAVDRAVSTAIEPMEQLLQALQRDVAFLRLQQLGPTPAYPASSCSEILAAFPSSPSDYYWLRAGNGSSIRVYCDMTRTCGGITGGWMQVANIDMTDSSHTCPQGLRTLTTPLRMCGRNITSPGCSSATFDSHGISYTRVCGKIIGYQDKSPNAFSPYIRNQSLTIDDTYIDGVSLTHGSQPRKHIWSFAAALDETQISLFSRCPCITGASIPIPPWVGNDYFCDSGAKELYQFIFYPDHPLWDGDGCGPTSTCCSFNSPPWFSKQLPSPTTDDIEMRLCVDSDITNEDVTVEKIELFVQ